MQPLLHPALFVNPPQRKRSWDWKVPSPERDVVLQASFGLPYRYAAWRPFDAPVKHNRHSNMNPLHQLDVRKLSRAWQIRDAESAIETAQLLVNCKMHTPIFDPALEPLRSLMDGVPRWDIVAPLDDSRVAFDYAARVVTHPAFAEVAAPPLPRTTRAFDIMRLEASAAMAVELGYIDNKTYKPFAEHAVEQLQRYYASWAEVAAAFWWGRLMFVADDLYRADDEELKTELQRFNPELTQALTDPDSPWRRFPLHA